MTKTCPCGSGETRRDLIDLEGIFCTFICDRCERQKRAGFNLAIFDGPYPNDEPVSDDPAPNTAH
jgi:hypothetical protein